VEAVIRRPLEFAESAGVFSRAARESGLLEWATAGGLALREAARQQAKKIAS
jgi:hypothetical protein